MYRSKHYNIDKQLYSINEVDVQILEKNYEMK